MGHAPREVVVLMASRDDLGEAHTGPPLDQVRLAPRQPDPARTQKVPPGPDGRQRHLSAVWDMVLESRGVQGTFHISSPCPIVVTGGSNLPEGQELAGPFAYRLLSGHWRLQTGVSRIEEQGTVTTVGVFGLNVVTSWDKRRPEWVVLAWLARVNVGRQRKMGVADVEEQNDPLTPSARKRKGRPPPRGHRAPCPQKPRVRPTRWSGRSGRIGRTRRQGGVRRCGCTSGWSSSCCCSGQGCWRRLRSVQRTPTPSWRPVCPGPTRTGGTPADVTKERDRLATKVKTLDRNLATARKAKPSAQAAQEAEGPEGAEPPPR